MAARPEEPDIDAWIESAARGDAQALRRLLDAHLPRLRTFIRLRMADLVQSVCRELLEHEGRFRFGGEAAFRRWLYTEALRKIAHRREYWLAERRNPGQEMAASASDAGEDGDRDLLSCYASFCTPSHAAMAREELSRVEAAFDRLPEHYRDVIVRARVLGLSRAEIAAESGCSTAAVGNLLFRALASLSSHLVSADERSQTS
jgi:RNA polymerase sigma factor (sigma-70 family)